MPFRDRNQQGLDSGELDPNDCFTLIKEKNPGNCNLIDVRTPREYHESRIAGATNINFFSPSFRAQVELLDPSTPCIVYCLKGNRGKSAMERMKKCGFKRVYNMSGGITGWKESGLPTEP